MAELIYPELSYKIVGLLFEVHKELGGEFEEKYYQRALEKLFIKNKLKFISELSSDLVFEDERIGKFILDFLVEDKIVVELKAVPIFHPAHFRQVKSYLHANNLRLGILANFRGKSLVYKRIVSG